MDIKEIYIHMDMCQDTCDACVLQCYHKQACPVACSTARIMYRLCLAYDDLMAKRRLQLLTSR